MPDELLPALPEPSFKLKWRNAAYYVSEPNIGDTDVFTADQLRAYAREAIRQQWRPISEAPKDAPWWLVWSSLYQVPVVVTQRMDDGTYWDGDWDRDVQANHWFPLSSPPAGEVA